MGKSLSVAVRLPSDSMSPTFQQGSILLGRLGQFGSRWDVVGFRHYLTEEDFSLRQAAKGVVGRGVSYETVRRVLGPPMGHYLSRVVGLGGEKIQVRADGIYIDGAPISPPKKLAGLYREFKSIDAYEFGSTPYKIPVGSLFLVNDNTGHVTDSRRHGPVQLGQVMGKLVTVGALNKLSKEVRSDIEEFHGL